MSESINSSWGVLLPNTNDTTRRVRTFGLTPAVSYYDEAAVPETGTVWFMQQIYLAALAIAVAEELNAPSGPTRVRIAEAIEAIACYRSLTRDIEAIKVRGSVRYRAQQPGEKKKIDASFQEASRRGFYNFQTFRMGTIQILPSLGLSTVAVRYNEFQVREDAKYSFDRGVVHRLVEWVRGKSTRITNVATIDSALPAEPGFIKKVRERMLSEEYLVNSKYRGRRNALWSQLDSNAHEAKDWQALKSNLLQEHVADIEAGARFFKVRRRAMLALDEVERAMTNADPTIDLETAATLAKSHLMDVRLAAIEAGDQVKFPMASEFVNACANLSGTDLLRYLVEREGANIRWDGEKISAGPNFRGATRVSADEQDSAAIGDAENNRTPESKMFPEFASDRLKRLHWLALDANGKLEEYFSAKN